MIIMLPYIPKHLIYDVNIAHISPRRALVHMWLLEISSILINWSFTSVMIKTNLMRVLSGVDGVATFALNGFYLDHGEGWNLGKVFLELKIFSGLLDVNTSDGKGDDCPAYLNCTGVINL